MRWWQQRQQKQTQPPSFSQARESKGVTPTQGAISSDDINSAVAEIRATNTAEAVRQKELKARANQKQAEIDQALEQFRQWILRSPIPTHRKITPPITGRRIRPGWIFGYIQDTGSAGAYQVTAGYMENIRWLTMDGFRNAWYVEIDTEGGIRTRGNVAPKVDELKRVIAQIVHDTGVPWS